MAEPEAVLSWREIVEIARDLEIIVETTGEGVMMAKYGGNGGWFAESAA